MKIAWWEWLPFQPLRIIGVVESADDIPARLPRHAAVRVASGDRQKWIAFDCPCGRGHKIMLNTDPARLPCWQIDVATPRRLTIAPSVDFHGRDYRCHYFVRNGRVKWV